MGLFKSHFLNSNDAKMNKSEMTNTAVTYIYLCKWFYCTEEVIEVMLIHTIHQG